MGTQKNCLKLFKLLGKKIFKILRKSGPMLVFVFFTVLARIFILVDLRTLLLYFSGSRKKIKFIFWFFFFFYPPTLNIICLVEKK